MKPERQITGGKRPRVVQARASSFTAAKRERFLQALSETCNIAMSCREAKVSESTVSRHRKNDASFRAGVQEAIRTAYQNLELAQLERALHGSVKTVTKADGSVDRTHEYPHAMAMTLLRLHREHAVPAEAEPVDEEDKEAVIACIARRIRRLKL